MESLFTNGGARSASLRRRLRLSEQGFSAIPAVARSGMGGAWALVNGVARGALLALPAVGGTNWAGRRHSLLPLCLVWKGRSVCTFVAFATCAVPTWAGCHPLPVSCHYMPTTTFPCYLHKHYSPCLHLWFAFFSLSLRLSCVFSPCVWVPVASLGKRRWVSLPCRHMPAETPMARIFLLGETFSSIGWRRLSR